MKSEDEAFMFNLRYCTVIESTRRVHPAVADRIKSSCVLIKSVQAIISFAKMVLFLTPFCINLVWALMSSNCLRSVLYWHTQKLYAKCVESEEISNG